MIAIVIVIVIADVVGKKEEKKKKSLLDDVWSRHNKSGFSLKNISNKSYKI